jgi:regulator of cell morphogenesis and NO signaling
MMSTTTEKTVRELAVENPATTKVFERLGIDYCCGGGRTLDEACRAAGVAVDDVLASIEAGQPAAVEERDWLVEPLADLVEHIKSTHHVYTAEAIARIRVLVEKVVKAHGERHPEVRRIQTVFGQLGHELSTHMMKEEMVLFPYIVRLEEAVLAGEPPLPAPFGTVANPVRMMEHEHDEAGEALRELRAVSNGYTAPADGCVTYRTLYAALAEFEADLHQHIHLENNILHPRAIAMER